MLWVSLLLFCCTTGAIASPLKKKPKKRLIVATYSFGDNNRLENIQPLALRMAQALNADLHLKSYRTAGQLAEGMRKGEAHVAFMSTYSYLLLQTDPRPAVVPLAALQIPTDTFDAAGSCLVASKDSGLETIADLQRNPQDYSIVFVGRHSVPGNLLPRLYLSSLQIKEPELQLKHTSYALTSAEALEEVKRGESDLAAISAAEYEKQLESGALKENEVVLLWQSERIPPGPVVCRTTFSARQQRKLQQVLLKAHRKQPLAISQITSAWPEAWEARRYEVISKDYYGPIGRLVEGSRLELRRVLTEHMK
jgi:phosphonate transport system substrate-binding protein